MDAAEGTIAASIKLTADTRPETYDMDGRTYFVISPKLREKLEETLSDTGPDYGKIASNFSPETLEAIYLAANSQDQGLVAMAALITYVGMQSLLKKQIEHYGIKEYLGKGWKNPEYEDYKQEAYAVIHESIHKYIPGKGSQVQNMMLVDIKRAYTENRNAKGGIKLPKHVNDTYNLINPVIQALRQMGQESPSPGAIAAYYNHTHPGKRELSAQTIANVLAAKGKTESIVPYDAEGIAATQKAATASPLGMLIQEEDIRELYETLDDIPEDKQDLVKCLMAVYSSPDSPSVRTGLPYKEVTAIYRKYVNSDVDEDWIKKSLRAILSDVRYKMTGRSKDEPVYFNQFDTLVTIGETEQAENDDILSAFLEDPDSLFF